MILCSGRLIDSAAQAKGLTGIRKDRTDKSGMSDGELMRNNYPNTMDARVVGWLTTVLFVVCECDALASVYFWSKHSASPFFFFAYFLPVITAFPWMHGMRLKRLLQPAFEDQDARRRSALSIQISTGTIVAYVLFGLSLTLTSMLRSS